ncbi:unnamed protein product [Chondrus crispus]|uniref:Uncharacterized protein n=1 Tax=Chondrus crispus TaxID=2769 RepID=R7Q6F7_CHOCR|nr:unnamed protein product [Chondrus crispus]CDF33423.1 unnamed protein product [Chondrus crispus]|eukprot:XP_005713226.1 unnamed protein product [Chondrus crispus]
MVKDANAEYRLDDGGAIESYSLKFSEITGNFSSATYLIHTSTNPLTDNKTLQQFIEDPVGPESAGDDSFKKLSKGLASVRCGNVWSHSKTIRGSASDFFESQVFRPHEYLSELVHIFHPYLKTKKDEDLIWSYSLGEAPEQVVGSKCPFTNLAGDPPEGRQYVDHEFKVSSLTRFEIEDKTESEILPKLRSATDLDGNFVELFFKSARATSGEDTKFTVRLAVKKEDAEDFESSDPMLKALRESMGEDVALVDGEEEESDSGGIGGWGIAAIVVSIVVLIAVVGFCALSRRRKRGAAPANGNWASAEAVGGSDEYVPMTAV